MRKYVQIIVVAIVATVLFGCTTFGTNITESDRAEIVKGKTTKVELLRKFGNPDQTVKLDNGTDEISYIKESMMTSYSPFGNAKNTEYWFLIKNGVVEDFGERETSKLPNYLK